MLTRHKRPLSRIPARHRGLYSGAGAAMFLVQSLCGCIVLLPGDDAGTRLGSEVLHRQHNLDATDPRKLHLLRGSRPSGLLRNDRLVDVLHVPG